MTVCMKKSDKSRYPILGMLLSGPLSGYNIIKEMHGSTDYFWQESDASIYPMLKTLEKEGKVKSRAEYSGKRESRIFEITPQGKKEFLAWMEMPTEIDKRRNEFLLKLFFGGNVSKEKILQKLFSRLEKVQALKRKFKSIERDTFSKISDDNPHKMFWYMTLRHGLIAVLAEIKWLNECINIVKKK
jgi:PadR family transcriptional regulator, regulatory protein AphA